MRTKPTIMAILMVAAVMSFAGPDTSPTNYFPHYTYMTNGAAATTNGIFFCLSELSDLSAAEADPDTGDIREIMYSLNHEFYYAHDALVSTNQFSYQTIQESLAGDSGNTNAWIQVKVTYTVMTKRKLSDNSVPSE